MEKKDIHEEITRLQSHIKVFEAYINKGKSEKGKRRRSWRIFLNMELEQKMKQWNL